MIGYIICMRYEADESGYEGEELYVQCLAPNSEPAKWGLTHSWISDRRHASVMTPEEATAVFLRLGLDEGPGLAHGVRIHRWIEPVDVPAPEYA